MKTVGEILKKARFEKQLTLEEVAKTTKIRQEFLEALEEDNFSKLPSYTSGRGFLKNYAEFLGLSSAPILAIFKRDFGGRERFSTPGEDFLKEKVRWTPKLSFMLVVIIFFLGLIFYLSWEYFSLRKTPYLEVFFPQQQARVSGEKIEVLGKAQVDALVTINDVSVALSPKGEFRYQQNLFPGENKIVVIAKSRMGKVNKVERTVFRLDNQ